MALIHLNADNFENEVLKSDVPVFVDFWATWCGPCKMLTPTVEKLEQASGGAYKVGKLDVDEASEIAAEYGIMSVPTVIVFKNGKIWKKHTGLTTLPVLTSLLD